MTSLPDRSRRSLLSLVLGSGAAPGLVACSHLGSPSPCFGLGVASGCPRADSVVLWTRLSPDARPTGREPVRWELAEDEAFRRVVQRGDTFAEAAWGHSVHLQPGGLVPGRWYWYRFFAMGQVSPVGRTRTAPAPGSLAPLHFAIGSCQRWDHGHYAAWRHLADEAPDLVVFLGDYIYEYPSLPGAVRRHEGLVGTHTLAQYRARYAQYKSDPDLQRIHASAPWLVTWDDHEVQNDYAGEHSPVLNARFLQRRAHAYRAWWEHMPLPPATRPRAAGLQVHERFDWGALARFHVLDNRQYRDPQACPAPGFGGGSTVDLADCPALAHPDRSLLGATQERWLAAGLAGSSARWDLIAQQALMAPFTWRADAPRHWTDGWSGYPAARQRLLDSLVANRVANPVVLGGDAHANYVCDLHQRADDPASPVVASEFCGTSISSRGRSQARLEEALPWNPHVRYGRTDERGYVAFRLEPERLEARLQVVSDARDPAATVRTAARFEVAAGRPGAERA